jgi:phage terminase large subunit GpA-like protein
MEKWFVDHQVFYGNTADLSDQCWEDLDYAAYDRLYKVEGAEIEISLIAIDSGYDPNKKREKDWDSKGHTVYAYVADRIDKFIAVKGTGETKSADLLKERNVADSLLNKRYDVATPIIKHMIMMTIENRGGPNSIHFPKWRMYEGVQVPIAEELFKQMMSERFQEVEPGKMGWKKQRERNEIFDIVIYAIAAMYHRHLQVWNEATWQTKIK